MIIRANDKTINAVNILGENIRKNGKTYPALRIMFSGNVTADELDALCSGKLEITDDAGNVVGTHEGYTTRGEHSIVIAKITTAEQERDAMAAALAVEEAKKPYVESLIGSLDDAVASTVIPLYPSMRYDGGLIRSGTRINWNGVLKRAAVNLWDREDSNPDKAPNLWEEILYREGYRIIPSVITVGLVFALDEIGWWEDALYRSKRADNAYTPAQDPDNWELVE